MRPTRYVVAELPQFIRDAAALQEAAKDFRTRFGVPDIVIADAGVSVGTSTQHAEDNAAFRAVLSKEVKHVGRQLLLWHASHNSKDALYPNGGLGKMQSRA